MLISVIIPSYKPQPYLYECLMSLEKQTFDKAEFEVIIILNGCNEPYQSEIEQFVSHVSLCVRVMQTDVPGVSNARNIGLDVAQGDFVTFVDDDDLVSETYLEGMYAIAAQGRIPLSNLIAFQEDDLQKHIPYYISQVYNDHVKEGIVDDIVKIRSYFSTSCCKLLGRDIIGERRFNVQFTHGEDSLFMFLISDRCHSFQLTSPDVVYYRRIREGSAIGISISWRFRRRLQHVWKCIWQYTQVYWSACRSYNLRFYITRVCAALRQLF